MTQRTTLPPVSLPATNSYKLKARLGWRKMRLEALEVGEKRRRLRAGSRDMARLAAEVAELRSMVFALAHELKRVRRENSCGKRGDCRPSRSGARSRA